LKKLIGTKCGQVWLVLQLGSNFNRILDGSDQINVGLTGVYRCLEAVLTFFSYMQPVSMKREGSPCGPFLWTTLLDEIRGSLGQSYGPYAIAERTIFLKGRACCPMYCASKMWNQKLDALDSLAFNTINQQVFWLSATDGEEECSIPNVKWVENGEYRLDQPIVGGVREVLRV